jgi:hypothetical protein
VGLLLLAFLAAASFPAWAQSYYGSVVGTVTDASGGAIPGATVTLTNIGNNSKSSTVTGAAGTYRFVGLVPAGYRIGVEMPGFKHSTREPIPVPVEASVRVDVALEVGAVTETVEVLSAAPLLQTETASLSSVVSGETVQEMPLNGRNVMNLIALSPGVVPQGGSSGAAQMNGGTNTAVTGWGNIQIGGGIANQSAFYIDGAANNSYQNFVALIPMQDAIQEFRVVSNNVSAEYGRYGGGVVSMATKTGGNRFHGSAYEYLRNASLNANDFFSNLNGSPRPKWDQNQYGAFLSGPIVKDKLFFFTSWEGFRARLGAPQSTNVPTAAMRAGLISGKATFPSAVSPSCYSYPTATTTQINPSCFDPTAVYMLENYYPLPNSTGTNNYYGSPASGNDSNQYNVRLDYNIGQNHRLFGRFTYSDMTDLSVNLFDNSTGTPWANNQAQQYVLGDTYTVNPTTVLDVRLSATRLYVDNNPVSLGVDLAQFGPAYAELEPELSYAYNPGLTFTGSRGLRGVTTTANFAWRNTYDFTASLTKITNRHTLKLGGNFRMQDNNTTPGISNASGAFTFNTTIVSDEFAAFLLGIPTSGSIGKVIAVGPYEFYQGYYATDTWQVSKELTLNLGIRWELPGALAERGDRATVLLPDTTDPVTGAHGTLGLVNSDLYSPRTTQEVKHNLFAPRVGFAYRPMEKMVIRGGYGISYLPNDLMQGMSPHTSSIISSNYSWTNTRTSVTHYLRDPFPEGPIDPPGRDDPNFMKQLLGQNLVSPVPDQPYPYVQQWNLSVQRQLAGDMMLEVSYAGSKGSNLPTVGSNTAGATGSAGGRFNLNQLSDEYYSLGDQLMVTTGGVRYGQTLRPNPAYLNVWNGGYFGAYSNYHAMQVRVEKRFKSAGVVMANYTWSKFMTNTDLLSPQFEAGGRTAVGYVQDFNDVDRDYSLSSNDVPHRLVVSYVLNLPFGKGRRFANWTGFAGALVSGWAINGVTTVSSGYPLALSANNNNLATYFGAGTIRPNVVAGCDPVVEGAATSRLDQWFNTACFAAPGTYSFGDASRTDPKLRSHGENNWDLALAKTTTVRGDVNVQFRVEAFNLFNRARFAPPATIVNGANFGKVTAQANKPRLIQLSLRVNF